MEGAAPLAGEEGDLGVGVEEDGDGDEGDGEHGSCVGLSRFSSEVKQLASWLAR